MTYTTWYQQPMVGFDVETTSTDLESARIIQAAIVTAIPGKGITTDEWLINPGRPSDPDIAALHRLDVEASEHGVDPAEAIPEIVNALHAAWSQGWTVVVFNAVFDLTILDREAIRHRSPVPLEIRGLVIDPYVLDKHVSDRPGRRTLGHQLVHYRIEKSVRTLKHTAAEDALAALRIAHRIGKHYDVGQIDPKVMMRFQKAWRAEQQRALRDYFVKRGNMDAARSCSTEWPLIP